MSQNEVTRVVIMTPTEFEMAVEKAANSAASKVFQQMQPFQSLSTDDFYGDFNWLRKACPVPAPTLRQWIANGYLKGVKKLGKRLLFEKATVLQWIAEQEHVSNLDHLAKAEQSFDAKHRA